MRRYTLHTSVLLIRWTYCWIVHTLKIDHLIFVYDDCLQAIVFLGGLCIAVRCSDCPVFLSGTFCFLCSWDEGHGEDEEDKDEYEDDGYEEEHRDGHTNENGDEVCLRSELCLF